MPVPPEPHPADALHVLSALAESTVAESIGATAARAVPSPSRVLDPAIVRRLVLTLRAHRVPAVVLATCHRLEVSWWGRAEQAETITALLQADGVKAASQWQPPRHGDEALHHLIAVASGLRSPRRGEPEILGQVRAAWQMAQQAGATTPALDTHLQAAIAAARYVRRTVSRTEAVSIGEAAVALLLRRWQAQGGVAARARVLIVGAGEVGQSVAQALASHRRIGTLPAGLSVHIANRTAARAEALAIGCEATPVPWEAWPELLAQCDVVIFSARSARPLVTRVQAAAAGRARSGPALWVDLASPPNVDAGDGLGAIAYANLTDLADTDAEGAIDLAQAEQVLAREVQLFRNAQQRRQAWTGLAAGHAVGASSGALLHAH